MTKERADEILRKVIYARIGHMPTMKDSEDAFHVGRVVGQMQRQLEIELSAEVDAESEEETNTSQWIFTDDCHEHVQCFRCGFGPVDVVGQSPYNYCPRCGAKMALQEDDVELC